MCKWVRIEEQDKDVLYDWLNEEMIHHNTEWDVREIPIPVYEYHLFKMRNLKNGETYKIHTKTRTSPLRIYFKSHRPN